MIVMNITLNQAALIRRSLKINPRPIFTFYNTKDYDLNDIAAVCVRSESADRVIFLATSEHISQFDYSMFDQQNLKYLMRWLQK